MNISDISSALEGRERRECFTWSCPIQNNPRNGSLLHHQVWGPRPPRQFAQNVNGHCPEGTVSPLNLSINTEELHYGVNISDHLDALVMPDVAEDALLSQESSYLNSGLDPNLPPTAPVAELKHFT